MKKTIEQLINPKVLWQKPVCNYEQAGIILILAGSRKKSHVPVKIAESAVKSGSFNLIIGYPEGLNHMYKDLIPNEYLRPLPETSSGSLSYKAIQKITNLIKESSIIIIGPSLGNNTETLHLMWDIIINTQIPCVIGGSAVASLVVGISTLRKKDIEIETYFGKIEKNIYILENNEAANLIEVIYNREIKNLFIKKPEQIALNIASQLNAILVIFSNTNIYIVDSEFISINNKFGDIYKNIIYGVIASFVNKNSHNLLEAIKMALYICEKAINISLMQTLNPSSSLVIKNIKKAIILAEEEVFQMN